MTIDEMIAVLQAAKEGKKIQARRYGTIIWGTPPEVWNFENYEYRVKPEPMEAFLWFDNYGHQFTTITVSEKDFESYKRGGYTPRKFREVIE